jgi:polyisoprenoid-binding protein YceI
MAVAALGVACAQPATPTAAPTVPTATAVPASAPAQGASAFAIVAEATEARYRVQEQLAGANLPNDAVGSTDAISGAIVIGADGRVVPAQSKVTVDLTRLASDSGQRDNFVKRNTLQTGQYPTAEFVATAVEGLGPALPTSGEVAFKLLGDLTVRGVTKPVTWDVRAQAGPREVAGTATTTVTFEQFGMTPPRVGPVLSVEDQLTLEMDFRVERSAA